MAQGSIPYLRTPDGRFKNLVNFPYTPKYVQYGELRLAYIGETNRDRSDTETFLCIHGEPEWSYIFRKMIPVFLEHTTLSQHPSRRVVVPDLLGFGRSDKPTEKKDYTFNFHRESLLHFIRTLDLTNITLVIQDWGGLLGLTLPVAEPQRFKRIVVMNSTIMIGNTLPPTFFAWRDYATQTPDLPVGTLMGKAIPGMTEEEAYGYDAPYPDVAYKVGAHVFPSLVMVSPDMEGVDVSKKSVEFFRTTDIFRSSDVFVAAGAQDPNMGPRSMKPLSKLFKHGSHYIEFPAVGHFVQEEVGEEIARKAIEVFEGKGEVEGVTRVEHDVNLEFLG